MSIVTNRWGPSPPKSTIFATPGWNGKWPLRWSIAVIVLVSAAAWIAILASIARIA